MSDNHEEHLAIHKPYGMGVMEQKHWVNKPYTFIGKIKFWLTGKPKPKWKTLIEMMREHNEWHSKLLDQVAHVPEVMKGRAPSDE